MANILAASTSEPTVAVRDIFDVVSAHRPAVDFVIRLQTFTNTWVLYLAQHLACFIATSSFYTFIVTKAVLSATAVIVSFLARTMAAQCSKTILWTWRSKPVVQLRKKVVFEFMVAILGPGNMLVILVFWPGWLLIFGAVWMSKSWMTG